MVPKRQTQTETEIPGADLGCSSSGSSCCSSRSSAGTEFQPAESMGPGSGTGLGVLGEPLPFRKKLWSIKITKNAGSDQVLFMGLPQLALSLGSLMCFWGTPDVAGLVTGPRGADSSAHPARPQPAASSKAILSAEDLAQGWHLGEFCLKSTFIRVVMTSLGAQLHESSKTQMWAFGGPQPEQQWGGAGSCWKTDPNPGCSLLARHGPRMALRSLQGGGVLL